MPYLTRRPDAPPPTESALLVAVPAAEPVVGSHRLRLDRAAGWGVPAHVTVLVPFVPPAEIDDAVRDRVAAAVRSVAAFVVRFARTGWFDRDVLWLAPDPDAPFRALTAAVHADFPGCPPYGGAFADAVPHLTVGERRFGDDDSLAEAERSVRSRLPVTARVDYVLLVTGTSAPDSWAVADRFALG